MAWAGRSSGFAADDDDEEEEAAAEERGRAETSASSLSLLLPPYAAMACMPNSMLSPARMVVKQNSADFFVCFFFGGKGPDTRLAGDPAAE